MKVGKIEVNGAGSPACSNSHAGKTHPGLAESAAAPDEVSLFRVGSKVALENGIIIIGQFGDRFGEGRKFYEQHTV